VTNLKKILGTLLLNLLKSYGIMNVYDHYWKIMSYNVVKKLT
jgi:hypothetical protein